MGTKEEQMRGGISAMFGDGQQRHVEPRRISPEEYEELEFQQSERRKFLTGRRAKDDPRSLVTVDDMRTSIIVDKKQYVIIKEIALRECVTIKDLIHAIFQLAIDKYEEKNGEVVPRVYVSNASNLFK